MGDPQFDEIIKVIANKQGLQGIPGDTGVGTKGDTGTQGDTGVGTKGDTGTHGDTGTQGDTGIAETALLLFAGEALTKGTPFYIKSDGKAWKANLTSAIRGIWQSASTLADAQGYGQITGQMTLGSWAWTPGVDLYSDTSGVLTTTVSTNGNIIAYAITATEIVIDQRV